jgi:hypothetical protein
MKLSAGHWSRLAGVTDGHLAWVRPADAAGEESSDDTLTILPDL